jgi:hypothetical protein
VTFIWSHFAVLHLPTQTIVLRTLLWLVYFWAYFATIFEGPGYLPFYFPKLPPPDSDCLSGVVTGPGQLAYMKRTTPPPYTRYFKSARRIVLRPDHFCTFTDCFIGKKNYKLFFLFNIYGVVYISLCEWNTVHASILLFRKNKTATEIALIILVWVYAVLYLIFVCFEFVLVMLGVIEIIHDLRQFELMRAYRLGKLIEKNPKKCWASWKSIFGGVNQCCCWPLPVPVFHGIDEYLLLDALAVQLDTETLPI